MISFTILVPNDFLQVSHKIAPIIVSQNSALKAVDQYCDRDCLSIIGHFFAFFNVSNVSILWIPKKMPKSFFKKNENIYNHKYFPVFSE